MSEQINRMSAGPQGVLVRFGLNSIAVAAIALGSITLPTATANAQWKLESGTAKKSSAATAPTAKAPVAKSNKQPSKKPIQVKEPSEPPSETLPQESHGAPKPVSMQVIEEDHQRFVHVPRAIVRCGPGSQYYATEMVSKGTAVEVYVETDDGWSGIRPPSGSHNWVQADALYLLPGGRVAEVSAETAPAWVGSGMVKSEKLLFQTELVKTQTVSILGEAYRGQSDQKKLWFKIAPPQGEFRWIKTSMLGMTPVAKDPDSKNGLQSNPPSDLVAQAAYEIPTEQETESSGSLKSELAWSDEAEQTRRIQQEIQREQQQSQSSILANAPKGSKTTPPLRSTPKPRQPIKPSSPSRQPRMGQPRTGQPPDRDPRHSIHPPPVSPAQTDSMSHFLGIFGLTLVDPNSIQGHPQRGRSPSATEPSTTSPPSFLQRIAPNPSNISSPSGALAPIENLPRPSGRYSHRRYSDFQSTNQESFEQYPSPLRRADIPDVSTASFAPSGSTIAAGNPVLDTYPQDRLDPGELEAFQTPQIQDALTQLSVIVSRPAEQWNLAPLRDSAQMWIERGETPLMRGEARLLLDRIERFESVRQRSSMTPLPGPAPYTEAVPMRSPASESEMSGWLVAVHTSLPGQPEFALTDDLGNVKAYVRPTTGLNLRRYVQQPVTVFGPQGFLPNLNAKQVVADRVVRLR